VAARIRSGVVYNDQLRENASMTVKNGGKAEKPAKQEYAAAID
jgi:hypothetical protein